MNEDAKRFQAWQLAALEQHPAGTDLVSFGPFRALIPSSNQTGAWVTIVEGTVGTWWRVIKSDYGTMQVGAQYEFVQRNTFAGLGGAKGSLVSPSANENMFLFSVRYYPFQ